MPRRIRTYDQNTVLDLVGRIYDAAHQPEGWRLFLEALTDYVGGSSSALSYVAPQGINASVVEWVRFDPEGRKAYNQHYFQLDPFARGLRDRALLRPGLVGLAGEVVSAHDLRNTQFYNDFGRQYGYAGGMTAVLGMQSSSFACVSVLTAEPSTTLEPSDVALLQLLVPHLTRALQLHERLTHLGATAEVFDRLPTAMVLIDATGKVISMNQSAERILNLRDGLVVSSGKLCSHNAVETRTLGALLLSATGTTAGVGRGGGGMLRLTRPSDKRPFVVLVTPLWRDNECGPGASGAGAVVFISDPECSPETSEDVLRRLYELTPAEARIVRLLVEGQSVADISEALAITDNTIRTHLKRIYFKTGTSSQSHVIRVVLTGPAAAIVPPRIR